MIAAVTLQCPFAIVSPLVAPARRCRGLRRKPRQFLKKHALRRSAAGLRRDSPVMLAAGIAASNRHQSALQVSVVYVHDLDLAEAFSREVLGLEMIGKEPGHPLLFRVAAASVLLLFLAQATLQGDLLPP
jgi:hypothetical protein